MRILYRIIGLAVLAAIGLVGWSYMWGGMRMNRDAAAFADNMLQCAPFDQDAHLTRYGPMNRAVLGPEGQTCGLQFATFGPEIIKCAAPMADMPAIVEAFIATTVDIDFFGVSRVSFSMSDDDAYTLLLNSEACVAE